MRKSKESIHGNWERGSGRTTRQIHSLRDCDVLLVHNSDMRDHARRIAYQMGKNITILILDGRDWSEPGRLRGYKNSVWIEVDHAAERMMGSGLLRFIEMHNDMVPDNG